MSLLQLLVIILVKTTIELDLFFIRHAARSPLKSNVFQEFKVETGELTQQGKCQAYYFGKQLKFRYPNISEQQLTIMSASKNRAYETAIYASKGWYQFNQKNGSKIFFLNSKYKPPVHLSYWPESKQIFIDQNLYKGKIMILDKQAAYGSKCIKINYKENQEFKKLLETIPSDQYCSKVEKKYPKYCQNDLDKAEKIKTILDLKNCLEVYNKTIPLTVQEVKPIIQLKNFILFHKFFHRPYQIAATTKMIQLLIDIISKGQKNLVLYYTHDTFIFTFLGILMGSDNFKKLFPQHIKMPFLSNLHIRIKNQNVLVFFNDKIVNLTSEIPGRNGKISETQFIKYLEKYMMDYNTICRLAKSNNI